MRTLASARMAWPLSLNVDSIAVYSTELMKLCITLRAATREVIRRCKRIGLSRIVRATSGSPTGGSSDADDYRPRVTNIDPPSRRRRYAVAHGRKIVRRGSGSNTIVRRLACAGVQTPHRAAAILGWPAAAAGLLHVAYSWTAWRALLDACWALRFTRDGAG